VDLQVMPLTVSGVTVLRVHAIDRDATLGGAWIVGTVELKESPGGAASIRQLYVRPDARRRGIGSRLLEYCCDLAEVKRSESLSLMLDPRDAKVALPFYRRHGFIVVAQYSDGEVGMAKVLGAGGEA
jgi:GNAT superfamily N-acetyltransferase